MDQDSGKSKAGHAELYEEGSGFAAINFRSAKQNGEVFLLYDEALVEAAITLLGLLVEHAVLGAGAGGDALGVMRLTGFIDKGVSLVHDRFHGFTERFPGTRVLDRFPEIVRSIDLEEVTASKTSLLIATRLFLNSFFQAFGVPEVPQVTVDGKIRLPYIVQTGRQRLGNWAKTEGVQLVETNLDQEP